jgi:hypothetical protein
LTPLNIFFINFANKIYHTYCIWIYNNKFFIIKWSYAMYMTNFVSKIDKKYT